MATISVAKTHYTLQAGTSLSFVNETGFRLQTIDHGDVPSLTIAGELRVSSQPGGDPQELAAVRVGYSSFYEHSLIQITRGGAIRVDTTATNHSSVGIYSGSWTPQIVNDGVIEVTSRLAATGVVNWGFLDETAAAVMNTGVIRVTAAGEARGIGMAAGSYLHNTGTVEVVGGELAVGVSFSQWDSTFRNSGEIRAHSSDPNAPSIAVWFGSNVKGSFINSGLLQGDIALKVESPFEDDPIGDAIFQNTGRMIGDVDMGVGGQALV
ncbi:MAG: hypothetical protein EON48_11715, partial [Acetobacteraceae bacterium]